MELERILKLMQNAQVGMEEDNTVYATAALDDAIIELKKIIEDGNSTKGVIANTNSKEDKEVVTLIPVILEDVNELEFWKQAYIAALNSRYDVLPEIIADSTIIKLRERGVKVL
ncbi:MAG: hypothetical protein PHV52_00055 [Aliarcobacter sp.]|nr:hypothetical protein [Aliarcobacter sp.]